MKPALPLLLIAIALAAPVAAQDEKPTCPDGTVESPEGCSQQAWVDDCPPDMMCAASHGNVTDGNGTDPCGGDPCLYGNGTVPYGPDDCIECSGPIDSGSCMDGTEEDCRDDVMYVGGPSRGPDDGSCENCRGPEAAGDGAANTAVGPGLAGLLVALAAVGAFARRR